MTNYRRANIPGGTYFFTANCANRHGNSLLTENIDLLRHVIRQVKTAHPFTIDAMVVLPDHLHCLWTLPAGDADYKTRWSLDPRLTGSVQPLFEAGNEVHSFMQDGKNERCVAGARQAKEIVAAD